MAALTNQSFESNLYLELSGTAATGVLFSDVTVKFKKFGSDTLTTKTMTTNDWVELGDGFYVLKWSPSEMDTAGKFFYTATGTLFDNFLFEEFPVEAPPLGALVFPDKCIITGNILDVGGNPDQDRLIEIRPVVFPAAQDGSIISARPVTSIADALGNFSIALIRNQAVKIEIKTAGIRHQITVPDSSSATLLSLLPPIPPPLP